MSLSVFCCVLLSIWVGLALWTDRSLDWICSTIAGVPKDVNLAWSFLLAVLAPLVTLFNVVVEILRSVL